MIPPRVETRQPLVIELDEPLDHAMLNRVLQVETSGGEIVSGEIAVDQEETRWQFVPTDPWPAGELQLVVDSTLEDRTGNSLQRPFEVRLDRPEDASNRSQPSVIRFQAVDGTR